MKSNAMSGFPARLVVSVSLVRSCRKQSWEYHNVPNPFFSASLPTLAVNLRIIDFLTDHALFTHHTHEDIFEASC